MFKQFYTYHWSFKMSKQIAPVTDEIFGCHILVMNRTYNFFLNIYMILICKGLLTLGGLKGYVSGTLISKKNVPPSYGVSGGPAISPFNSV